MKKRSTISVSIKVTPWLLEHRDGVRAVLPATLALQLMARAVGGRCAATHDAAFHRFMVLPDEGGVVSAEVECAGRPDGTTGATLSTVRRVGKMSRRVEHVVAKFSPNARSLVLPPDLAVVPEGPGIRIDPKDIYEQLVPFGHSFHNVEDPVWLTTGGATSTVKCPGHGGDTSPLGSLFALDAAFHLCCVWSQRYCGTTMFPVGFSSRTILDPIRKGARVRARIVPRPSTLAVLGLPPVAAASWRNLPDNVPDGHSHEPDELLFDIWLFDQRNRLREACFGVRMFDISKGRLTVPGWVRRTATVPTAALRAHCAGLTMLELAAIPAGSQRLLSSRERRRWNSFGQRRQRSYLGSRLALKTLSRQLDPLHIPADPKRIHTLAADGIRPRTHCSGHAVAVAHDARWVIAVAGEQPIGVDVEPIDEKAMRGMRLFLSRGEQRLVGDRPDIATRFWTIKEAAAKALNIPLAEAWSRVIIKETGPDFTIAIVDGELVYGWHEVIDEHVFTVLQLPGAPSC